MIMVDFQTLTLFSLTLLTAAMFIFYYLLVIKVRRTPHVTRRIPRTSIEPPTSMPRTKTEAPTLRTIQIRSQAPIQVPSQPPIQTETHNETPIKNQDQTPSQTPAQVVSQITVSVLQENALNLSAKPPVLRGEAATEALKQFAEELEKGKAKSSEKTRDASLIKLARVLIDAIQTEKEPENTPKIPNQNSSETEQKRKASTKPTHKQGHTHQHNQSRKKKTKAHQPNKTRKTNRKIKNKKTKIKKRERKRPTKKRSKQRARR